MTQELKPCPNPWCEAAEREGDFRPQVQYSNFGLVYVACTSCTMAGPTRQHEADAIAAWNTRQPDPLVAELRETLANAWDHIQTLQNDISSRVYRFEELKQADAIVGADDGKYDGMWASYRDEIETILAKAGSAQP